MLVAELTVGHALGICFKQVPNFILCIAQIVSTISIRYDVLLYCDLIPREGKGVQQTLHYNFTVCVDTNVPIVYR